MPPSDTHNAASNSAGALSSPHWTATDGVHVNMVMLPVFVAYAATEPPTR